MGPVIRVHDYDGTLLLEEHVPYGLDDSRALEVIVRLADALDEATFGAGELVPPGPKKQAALRCERRLRPHGQVSY